MFCPLLSTTTQLHTSSSSNSSSTTLEHHVYVYYICRTYSGDFCCTPRAEHVAPRLTTGLRPRMYLGRWYVTTRIVVALSAPHLGGSRTGQDPQSKVHTAACLISPNRGGPIEARMFMSLLALLLCYCITYGPPSFVVILVAVTVQQQPCCELCPL